MCVLGRPFGLRQMARNGKNVVLTNSNKDFKATVQTVFHVITRKGIAPITDEQLFTQLDVLNADFEATGFTFELVNVTHTNNGLFYSGRLDKTMKSKLHVGDSNILNVYINNARGLQGYATMPDFSFLQPNASFVQDGVVIQDKTLPGGSLTHFNLGRTLTHQVGQ